MAIFFTKAERTDALDFSEKILMNVSEVCCRVTVDSGLWDAQKGAFYHSAPATNVGFGVHVLIGLRTGRLPFSWPSEISFHL